MIIDLTDDGHPPARRPAAVLIDLENLVLAAPHHAPRRGHDVARVMLQHAWRVANTLCLPRWNVVVGHRALVSRVVDIAASAGLRLSGGPAGCNRADRELVDRATTDLPSGIDTVVLVSGDGDFIPLVVQQQSRGLDVIVVSWRRSLSMDLAATADDHVLLEDHLELAA